MTDQGVTEAFTSGFDAVDGAQSAASECHSVNRLPIWLCRTFDDGGNHGGDFPESNQPHSVPEQMRPYLRLNGQPTECCAEKSRFISATSAALAFDGHVPPSSNMSQSQSCTAIHSPGYMRRIARKLERAPAQYTSRRSNPMPRL